MLVALLLVPVILVVGGAGVGVVLGLRRGEHRTWRGAITLLAMVGLACAPLALVAPHTVHTYVVENHTASAHEVVFRHVDGSLLEPCALAPGEACTRHAFFRLGGESYMPVRLDGVELECGVYVSAEGGPPVHAASLRESTHGLRCESRAIGAAR